MGILPANRHSGDDTLLFFLAENTKLRSASAQSTETFSDIISRNLYSPRSPADWGHLIQENRVLHTVCYRGHIWELATAAMRVSPDIRQSWVVQSDPLKRLASMSSSLVK